MLGILMRLIDIKKNAECHQPTSITTISLFHKSFRSKVHITVVSLAISNYQVMSYAALSYHHYKYLKITVNSPCSSCSTCYVLLISALTQHQQHLAHATTVFSQVIVLYLSTLQGEVYLCTIIKIGQSNYHTGQTNFHIPSMHKVCFFV